MVVLARLLTLHGNYSGILFKRATFLMMIMELCSRWSFMFRFLTEA
jgi:hypothetical protein